MDKVVSSSDLAVADVPDGATIMCGGFGLCGIPENLIRALVKKGAKGLTVISNNIGSVDKGGGAFGVALLFQNRQVSRFVGSFPGPVTKMDWFMDQYRSGALTVEIMPQGTLNERIRCAGAGLGGVLTPTGVGTVLADGKQVLAVEGKEYLLELPLRADYAFVRAWKGDRMGNLVYRGTARNYNPVMAPAGRVTIAEVEQLVETGSLDPDQVHTPGVYVKRVVKGEVYERRY